MSHRPYRVLIPFNTDALLYGMERAVIETFDLLRPDVEPLFLVSRNPRGVDYPVLRELERRRLPTALFSDRTDWPRLQKPCSLLHLARMLNAFLAGNRDVLRHTPNCDAIYLPGVDYGLFALAAMLHCRLQHKPVFHQFHSFSARPSRQLAFVNHFVTDHIHITEFGLKTVSGTNPCILRRSNHVIPHSVDPPPGARPRTMPESFRGHRNIVYAGQISLTKGLDILLDAFALIAARYPDVRLHILGALPANDDPIAVRLRACDNRIQCPGFQEDIYPFFENAFVVAQSTPPSRCQESFGRTVVEAAMAGIPVVCFASGALPGIVSDGVTGTVCREETALAIATAMSAYLDDPAMRDRHAARARTHVEALFSRTAIRQKWLRMFGLGT